MIFDTGLPIVGYKFAVVIFTAGLPNPIDLFFKDVSGLNMNRSIEYQGNRPSLGNSKQSKTLTLKRGVFKAVSPLTITNTLESIFWNSHAVRKDILISILNDNYIPLSAWLITRAFMDSWQWDNLDANSNDVLIETMSFTYQDIKHLPLQMLHAGTE